MTRYLKTNHSSYADQLILEKHGLDTLRNQLKETHNHLIRIPKVYSVNSSTLELNSISAQSPNHELMERLGKGLALLHSQHFDQFGLDRDNYIGLSPQLNQWSQNWGEFFVDYRLTSQINRIKQADIAHRFQQVLKTYRTPLINFLNKHCHGASLLHGDLWSGNVLFDDEHVWLIDPAIYYGDREVDIAMTELFGSFHHSFYKAYDALNPRTSAYPIKRTIYNLYHYLNHYNLFGDTYLAECDTGFKEIQNVFID